MTLGYPEEADVVIQPDLAVDVAVPPNLATDAVVPADLKVDISTNTGIQGPRGAGWFHGYGPPHLTSSDGIITNDMYMDIITGDVYAFSTGA